MELRAELFYKFSLQKLNFTTLQEDSGFTGGSQFYNGVLVLQGALLKDGLGFGVPYPQGPSFSRTTAFQEGPTFINVGPGFIKFDHALVKTVPVY